MTDDPHNGGDIASGHGDSTVTGPVSDEKAEQMKRNQAEKNDGPPSSGDSAGDAEGDE